MKTILIFPLKALSIGIISVMLSACGGGGDDSGTEPTTPQEPPVVTPPVVTPPVSRYPEPKQDVLDDGTLGFYDYNGKGEVREIRPDLVGSLQAMIQFGQNHTVDPQGNEAKNMHRLTSEKEALLLVTPTTEMGNINKLVAEIYKDGVL